MRWRILTAATLVVVIGGGYAAWSANTRRVANAMAYQRLVDVVVGTVADRMASELVGEHRRQKAFQRCVEAAGGRYVQAPYHGLGAALVVPGDITVGTPLAGTFGIGASERRLAQGAEAYAEAVRAARVRGLPAPGAITVSRCQQAGNAWQNYPRSTAATAMYGQFEAMLAKVQHSQRSRPLLKAYALCMTASGYPATEWSSTRWRVFEKFRTPDHTTVSWSQLRLTTHWRESVAYEKAAGAADTRCRRPLHTYAMHALRRDVDTFTATHTAQLELAERQWAQLRSAQHAAGLK